MRLKSDTKLRKSLYGLYTALFNAKLVCPEDFPDGRLTTIQTAIMGIENLGWRVIGITNEALELLALNDFNKNKLPRRLCRGHKVDRIVTTREMFNRDVPMSIDDFFDTFMLNDCTVIMLNEQNNHAKPFPEFVSFENPNAELFPNGSLIGWKHRKIERDFLRQLHSSLNGVNASSKF